MTNHFEGKTLIVGQNFGTPSEGTGRGANPNFIFSNVNNYHVIHYWREDKIEEILLKLLFFNSWKNETLSCSLCRNSLLFMPFPTMYNKIRFERSPKLTPWDPRVNLGESIPMLILMMITLLGRA